MPLDRSSPAYVVAQYVDTISHDVITNEENREHKFRNDLSFFTHQVDPLEYGLPYCRFAIALNLTTLCGVTTESLQDRDPSDWIDFIDKVEKTYMVLLRKDATKFFASPVRDDDDDDDDDFQMEQKEMVDEEPSPKAEQLLSKKFDGLIVRLRFQHALSYIRHDLETLFDEQSDGDAEFSELDGDKLENFL